MKRVDPGWHVLINATVVTEPGVYINRAMIVIRNGVIESITPGASGPVPPAGARVWDYRGLMIYPGLVESWLPVDAPRPDSASAGVHWNSRVAAERSALDGSGVSKDTREKLRAQGFTVAHISPTGGIFRGTTAIVSLGEERDPSNPLAGVLSSRVGHTVSLETGGWREDSFPNSKMGAIALIRQTFADVPWYRRAMAAYASDPAKHERPTQCNALTTLDDARPLVFDVDDEQDILRASKIAKEFGRSLIAVTGGSEYRRLGAVAESGVPLVLPLRFATKPRVESISDFEAVDLSELMAWEQAPTNPRRVDQALSARGVPAAITSSKLPKGQDFFANLRTAIDNGLSEDRALAMLTTQPAKILGIENRVGKIAPGFAANMVVVKGSLFDEKRVIRDVWIDGERYEVKRAPDVELNGRWDVALPIAPDGSLLKDERAFKGQFRITDKNEIEFVCPQEMGTQEKPDPAPDENKPEEKAPERKVSARVVSVIENRVSFVIDLEKLYPRTKIEIGQDAKTPDSPAPKRVGVITFSGVVENDVIRGDGVLPRGERFSWRATRVANLDREEEKPKPAPEPAPELYGLPFGAYGYDAYPEQKSYVITGGTIWTSGPAGTINDGVLAVDRGKVTYVGPASGFSGTPTPGAVTIDAKGKHVTPGLIDCHSHTGISGGVNEGTQSCTAEVRIFDVIDPDAIGWYRELAGGITAVNQLHGSANAIGGQNSVVKLRWGCTNPDDMRFEGAIAGIKFALGENVKQSNWGERFTSRYPQTRMGVETFIRDRFTAAREYAARWTKWEKGGGGNEPQRDLELEALAEILAGKRLVHCHSYRQDEVLMLCRIAQDFGFTIGTFQHILEGYKVAEAIRAHAIGGSSFSDWWAYKFEVVDAIPDAGAIMHDAGVVVSFNSDSDEMARRMNTEAAKAMKYGGLPPEEALKFVTLNPAKQLKIDNRVGSLERGKDADFVIWSGDPLSSLSRCEATYVDGREMFSLAKDAAMRARTDAERTRIAQKVMALPKEREDSAKKGDDGPTPRQPEVDSPPPPELDISDLRAGGTSLRRLLVPVGADGDYEAARKSAMMHQLETRFCFMIRNGIDPYATQPGDCGCGVHSLYMLGGESSW